MELTWLNLDMFLAFMTLTALEIALGIDNIIFISIATGKLPEEKRKKIIGISDIERVVAKIARVPRKSVSASDRTLLKNLSRDLKLVIFGQNEAVETIVDAVKMGRSGLGDTDRPVASFLFAGPTGVGKTEVALRAAFIRLSAAGR